MNDDAPKERTEQAELPAIDFHSPGRFAVHNPPPDLPEPEAWVAAPFRLGRDVELQRFDKPTEVRQHALAMLQQATRALCIYSTDLEPGSIITAAFSRPALAFCSHTLATSCVSWSPTQLAP